jgi:hypothetical protein
MIHVRLRRAAAGLGAAALLATVAACSSQGGPTALPTVSSGGATSAPAAATATPSGTSRQAAAAAQKALTAYRGAFADWASVAAIPSKADYQNPQLADHLTGDALSYVTGSVYIKTNVDGGVTHGKPVLLHPAVTQAVPAANPTQIVITDCISTNSWLLYTTDGHLYNDVPGGRDKTEALVAVSDGVWKVSKLVIQTDGTC